ncbi:hypothetical protein ACKP2L_00510 (plasmid) [Oenococcus alcoholitolerans]|uniref:hypothetical protein n=1 Tax=Oenococcus alcoholitolerans TaxID=931074 RepID=UPI003F6E80D9
MTELSYLANLLIDKQRADQIPSGTSFEDSLLFSKQHGYGPLAIEVAKKWAELSTDNKIRR